MTQHGHLVGKCPSTITEQVAEAILNQAVAEPDPFRVPDQSAEERALPDQTPDTWPKRLYAVHKGVIYEAVPTNPGKSYHGYPWCGRQGRGPLPSEIVDQLRDQARAEGYLDEFEDWLDQYS